MPMGVGKQGLNENANLHIIFENHDFLAFFFVRFGVLLLSGWHDRVKGQ